MSSFIKIFFIKELSGKIAIVGLFESSKNETLQGPSFPF